MVFHAGVPLAETFPGRNAIYIYNKLNKNTSKIIVAKEIDGRNIKSLNTWDNYVHKDEITKDVDAFKQHLRDISNNVGDFIGIPDDFFDIITPILKINEQTLRPANIANFIVEFEKAIANQSKNSIAPNSLVYTDLGRTILNELKSTKFSDSIFCHNYLCYKSFVLKKDKLIGITNWQYAGYYPPEFEDIISKYLQFI